VVSERWIGVTYRNYNPWDRDNYVIAVVALIVAIIACYLGVAVVKNYWPWLPSSSDETASLPAGYAGTWKGDIDVPFAVPGLGHSATVVMTLWPGEGMGQDVGSLTVKGPSVLLDKPDCTAGLHWQSGHGPVSLTYDSGNATGICAFVAKLANATITLVGSGELDYQVDLSGIRGSSAALYSS
jgi:hypothetical protein